MKKLFILLFMVIPIISLSQHITQTSKTFYDEGKTKMKEVYSYIEINTIFNQNKNNQISNKLVEKHGPYFYYYENGKIKIRGNYRKDKKHGEWYYYNESGVILKIESYSDDELIDVNFF